MFFSYIIQTIYQDNEVKVHNFYAKTDINFRQILHFTISAWASGNIKSFAHAFYKWNAIEYSVLSALCTWHLFIICPPNDIYTYFHGPVLALARPQ